MNDTVNNLLLTVDKFMPETHSKHLGFTYSACGPFTNHRERIQRFIQTGNLKYLYINELGKDCFDHDAGYSDNKDLTKRTQNCVLKEHNQTKF